MNIYHLIPTVEFQRHEFSSECACNPAKEEKGADFWLGVFVGREVCQHNYLTPRSKRSTPRANDFAAVADKDWT